MIALIIAESNNTEEKIKKRVKPYGFRCIRYTSAVKALDNIPEINPELICISASDFPRHWKTIAQFVRGDSAKTETVIIVLVNERFTEDDVNKALHIGVQATINENFESEKETNQLSEIFSRYKKLKIDSPNTIELPSPEKVSFMFTHPINNQIITGYIQSLSMDNLVFYLDDPSSIDDLNENEILTNCSFAINENLISLDCKIENKAQYLTLSFYKISESDRETIKSFISPK